MLRGKRPQKWCRGEFGNNIIYRFLLMLFLWIFYALVPHELPTWTLHVYTGLLLWYAFHCFRHGYSLNGWVIIVAAMLNSLLAPMLAADMNTLWIIVVIFFLLLWDVVNAPA